MCGPVCGYKTLAANRKKVVHVVAAVDFRSLYLSDALPYVQHHITIK